MENVERILEAVAAVGTILTLAATVLPADWEVTRFCARFGADLRGLRK